MSTLRVRPVSDLHVDVSMYNLVELEHDKETVLTISGDLSEMGDQDYPWADWFHRTCPRFRDVLFVPGNHEHYGGKFGEAFIRLRDVASRIPNLHVLHNRYVKIDHVHFVGTTLWTNYRNGNPIELIKMRSFSDHVNIGDFTPENAVYENAKAQSLLKRLSKQIEKKEGEKLFVMTHHAPTSLSEDPRFFDSPIASAFSSDLDELVYEVGADVWQHGHIHWFKDYSLFGTRIVCNPRGYHSPRPGGGSEATGFKSDFLLEV